MELNKIYHMDCLEGMKEIPDRSIDAIICDLPYGLTACKWDTVIPFDQLWEQYERIIKDNGAIVLNSQMPFTAKLINSNYKMFRYCWIWNKNQTTGFLNAKKQPLRVHEDICVFYKKMCVYNPQMTKGKRKLKHIAGRTKNYNYYKDVPSYYSDEYYPKTILEIPQRRYKNGHPTQKPVALIEYLVKTYTNEGETVLDNCMGSGTTAIACINTNRNFIGFEIEKKYVDIANKRISDAYGQKI